ECFGSKAGVNIVDAEFGRAAGIPYVQVSNLSKVTLSTRHWILEAALVLARDPEALRHVRGHAAETAGVPETLRQGVGRVQVLEHARSLAERCEHRLKLAAKVDGLRDRVVGLGQMAERRQGVLQARGRFSPGASRGGLRRGLAKERHRLRPSLAA